MALQFLEFDLSEDADGAPGWDALASPAPVHNAALLAEVAQLLDLLHTRHGPPGPLDDGHDWDCDMQIHHEDGTPLDWHWDAQGVRWSSGPAHASSHTPTRLTLGLCLTGNAAFTHTFEQEVTPT